MSIKAISIQAVSQRMFLILDSHGDLHLLSLSNSGIGVDLTGNVRPLSRTMKVKSVAVLPDLSSSKCHFPYLIFYFQNSICGCIFSEIYYVGVGKSC